MRRPVVVTATLLLAGTMVAASCSGGSSGVSTQRADDPAIDGTASSEPPSSDVPSTDATSDATSDTGDPTKDSADDRIERGTLDWASCPDSANAAVELECATLSVPLDYADPTGVKIDIAVARTLSSGSDAERLGSLVFNPGGPGGSGIEALRFLPLTMSARIAARFDMVSFDPRGVGRSAALACDADFDDNVSLIAVGDDAGWSDLLADNDALLARCTPDTLDLAQFVGTNNAARDLDMLRAALGDDGLTYVGYSYGTRLGATYAELFADNVRALVFDAGVKPTSDSAAIDREQGAGFDRALENFAAACDADPDCVLRDVGPTLDVIEGLEAEIADVGSFPTDDPDRVLTPGELSLGIVAALYSKDSWPFLASALFTAEAEQDGTLLQVLGDSLVGRQADGTYDNSQIANGFISCADDAVRVTADEQRVIADDAAVQSAHFDEFLRASTGCLGVVPAIDPIVIGPAAGAAPIVVIGNTGDPATPYEWSVELAASLDSALLYTVEAEGHTAYGTIECVGDDIDDYLIDLVVPERDATCSDNESADFFVPAGDSELDQVLAFFDCLRDEGADIAEFSAADILADPTLETILGDVDFSDPSMIAAVGACQDFIPEL